MIQHNISLEPYNTFNIDVNARYFTTVQSLSELQILLSQQKQKIMPILVLGGGSNILFTQDFHGLVIHNQITGIEKINENNDHIFLKVGAGENWHHFILYCIENNYAGIENLSLIPGLVGAAPVQNIGAYGVEIKEVLQEVHAIDIEKNTSRVFNCAECELSYRDSIFKNALKNKYMITHVVFRLNKKPVFHVEYGTIQEKLNGAPLSIRAISNIIVQIRKEKLPDPAIIPNAGSFFKNPIVPHDEFLSLQKKYPKIPYFPEENNHMKIPAAWLIEQCGFKGKRVGNTGVHEHQALVLMNHGNATGQEIKALGETIQREVAKKFTIHLLTEVNIY